MDAVSGFRWSAILYRPPYGLIGWGKRQTGHEVVLRAVTLHFPTNMPPPLHSEVIIYLDSFSVRKSVSLDSASSYRAFSLGKTVCDTAQGWTMALTWYYWGVTDIKANCLSSRTSDSDSSRDDFGEAEAADAVQTRFSVRGERHDSKGLQYADWRNTVGRKVARRIRVCILGPLKTRLPKNSTPEVIRGLNVEI
jgi:hypothetical protein